MVRRLFAIGALMGFLAVAAGSFGAHALDPQLSPKMKQVFEVGVRYHMYHALALLGAAWAADRYKNRAPSAAGGCFVVGIVLFSGSLYLLVLTGASWLGMVAPIGGLALLAGWVLLAVAAVAKGCGGDNADPARCCNTQQGD